VNASSSRSDVVLPTEEYSDLERAFLDAADNNFSASSNERTDWRRPLVLGLITAALLFAFVLVLGQWSGDMDTERYAAAGLGAVLLAALAASFFRSRALPSPLSAADWLQLWRTDRYGPGQVLAFDPMAGSLVDSHALSLQALAEFIWQGRINATILRSHFHLLPPPGALQDSMAIEEAIAILQIIGVDLAQYANRPIGSPAKTTFKIWKRGSVAAGFKKR
jgi:hypothetical protein